MFRQFWINDVMNDTISPAFQLFKGGKCQILIAKSCQRFFIARTKVVDNIFCN